MDIDKLKLLYDTAHIGSIKKAADQLSYTQSGLLYAINTIESSAGITLLNRTHQGISLTKEGAELEPFVKELITAQKAFEQKRDSLTNSKLETLRIISHPSIVNNWIPEIMRRMSIKGYSNFQIFSGDGKEILNHLEEGLVDLAIVEKECAGNNQWIPLSKFNLYVAVPADAPFAPDTPLSLPELEGYNILLPRYTTDTVLKEWVLSMEKTNEISLASGNGSMLLHMVQKKLGITFLSGIYLNECPEGVHMHRLEPPIIKEFGIIYKPNASLSPAMEAFITEASKYSKK